MIETPLFGRFVGENRRLVFEAAPAYHVLVRGTIFGGLAGALYGLLANATGMAPVFAYPAWWLLFGALVAGAGALAAFSLQSISFDLRESRYRRRQGPGLFPYVTHGRLDALDALVLIAEPSVAPVPMVTYHLVLHWKGILEPPMVVQQDSRAFDPSAPLSQGAWALREAGMRYAQALGVAFYDNSHFPSRCPTAAW